MTVEDMDTVIQMACKRAPGALGYELTLCWVRFKATLAEKDAEIAVLNNQLENAEAALRRKGYERDCHIAACNCGSQWNHGGHAEERLREISDALPYENGKTILQRVEQLQAEKDKQWAVQLAQLIERLGEDHQHAIAKKDVEIATRDLYWKRRIGLDCGGHSCLFAIEKTGMRHNGPCQCKPAQTKKDYDALCQQFNQLQATLAEKDAEIAYLASKVDALRKAWSDDITRKQQLQAELDRVMGALEKIMIGGNHLALQITNSFGEHPLHDASFEEAATFYKVGVDGWDGQAWKYDVWICWKAIMQVVPLVQSYQSRQGKV